MNEKFKFKINWNNINAAEYWGQFPGLTPIGIWLYDNYRIYLYLDEEWPNYEIMYFVANKEVITMTFLTWSDIMVIEW